jgi:hypothetical protein
MNPVEFDLRFSEQELADAIFNSKPPPGIKIFRLPSNKLDASATAGEIYFQVWFHINLNQASVAAIATWFLKELLANVKKRKDKNTRINQKKIRLEKRDIIRLIEERIAAQNAREQQWHDNQKNKVKKKNKTT